VLDTGRVGVTVHQSRGTRRNAQIAACSFGSSTQETSMYQVIDSSSGAGQKADPRRVAAPGGRGPNQSPGVWAVTRARLAYGQALWALVDAFASRAADAVRVAYPGAATIEIDTVLTVERAPGVAVVRLVAVRDGRGEVLADAGHRTRRMRGLQELLGEMIGGIVAVVPDASPWQGRRTLALAEHQAW
jgi:hypothetical protein